MPSAVANTDTYEASVMAPVGGDPRSAASVREGLEDLSNRTTYLNNRWGKLAAIFHSTDDTASLGAPGVFSAGANLTVGTTFQNLAGSGATSLQLTATDLKAGDRVWLEAVCRGYITAPATIGCYRIGHVTGTIVALGAYQEITTTSSSNPEWVYMRGVWTVPADVASQLLSVMVATNNAAGVITTVGPKSLTARVYRP